MRLAVRDMALIDRLAVAIADYRAAGLPAPHMQRALLERFPEADSGAYAIGIIEANRRGRADVGNG